MATENSDLPERTDKVIPGASATGSEMTDTLVAEPTKREKAVAKVREQRDKIGQEAAGKARGLVGQGLERGSEGLGNVARLVSDTADSIDEQVGKEYGDYARKAANYLDETSRSLAQKDPDELIDDTRDFVRRSPGIALAGAAIVGFAVARLIQSGFDAEKNRD